MLTFTTMDSHLDYIEKAHEFDTQNFTDEEVKGWGNVLFHIDSSWTKRKRRWEYWHMSGI